MWYNPNWKKLVGSLLYTMYEGMKKQIDENLAVSGAGMCLTSDA